MLHTAYSPISLLQCCIPCFVLCYCNVWPETVYCCFTRTTLLTLGAHAQEGYCSCLVCVCVCLSVCLSVTTLAVTSFVFTLKSRYMGVCYRLFLDFNRWSDISPEISGLFWFFQSLTASYKLPGIVRQRATSLQLYSWPLLL